MLDATLVQRGFLCILSNSQQVHEFTTDWITCFVKSPMEVTEALMTPTPFSEKYGSMSTRDLSFNVLWQYDSTASTVPFGTLHNISTFKQIPAKQALNIECLR